MVFMESYHQDGTNAVFVKSLVVIGLISHGSAFPTDPDTL